MSSSQFSHFKDINRTDVELFSIDDDNDDDN